VPKIFNSGSDAHLEPRYVVIAVFLGRMSTCCVALRFAWLWNSSYMRYF
jgi:hypothetical protein